MSVDLRYLGRSEVHPAADGLALSLAPNLARPRVFFDAEVRSPVRFREAMSALHAVVVSDGRFVRRSGSAAYEAYKAEQAKLEAELRAGAFRAKKAELDAAPRQKMPAELRRRYKDAVKRYWRARDAYLAELARRDPTLWRRLVPYDPVITVAPDVVMFEGFARDESQYGCLIVDRDAFTGGADAGLGTTNVDYSLALYEHLQTLRSYRTTRLSVDPTGFDVAVEGLEGYREEKVDLPPSWLRGFAQVTASMALPGRRLLLDVPTVYALLAHLERRKERHGPRALRFSLVPGKRPVVHLEPWDVALEAHGPPYDGEKAEVIRVWGRRRLRSLARVLPLADFVEVRLLGDGLPSAWVAHMGDMRFVLGLSGWTTSSWTAGAALDLLTDTHSADPMLLLRLTEALERERSAKAITLSMSLLESRDRVLAGLQTLARQGQLVFDFAHEVYRWRPILPAEQAAAIMGPEHPELAGARALIADTASPIRVLREDLVGRLRVAVGSVGGREVEVGIDADGVLKKGRCDCSWFYRNKLRQGPCRHLLALRAGL
jgi:hypothetical protein